MEQVKRYTEALVEAIWESEAYLNYEKIKKKVAERPELKAKINDFRRRNYELQNQEEDGSLYEKMEEFEEEYHEVRKDPLIRDYLQCELEICRMMQRINLRLAQAVDLELEDFQDSIEW